MKGPASAEEFLERCNLLMLGQRPEVILRRALAVIREPSQWTRGARARDAHNNSVHPAHPSAVKWCVEGAISMACNPYGILPPYFMKLLDPIAQEHGAAGIGELNEYWRHEVVLQVLETAIIRCAAPVGGSYATDERTDGGGDGLRR